MNMDEGAAKLAAPPNASCCSLSNAPVPAALQKAFEFSVAATLVMVFDATLQLPRTSHRRPAQIERALSLRPLRSLLCTFLI